MRVLKAYRTPRCACADHVCTAGKATKTHQNEFGPRHAFTPAEVSMNRLLPFAVSFFALPLVAQTLPAPPTGAPPSAPARTASVSLDPVTQHSRIAHTLEGPDGRPQGFLLRNGTFVSLTPGLSQQLPTSLQRGASLTVSGFPGREGAKTIQARSVTVAGVSYSDAAGVALLAGGAPRPPAPQRPAAPGAVAPPPPPPVVVPGAPAPPPPPPGGPGAPPPPTPPTPGAPPQAAPIPGATPAPQPLSRPVAAPPQ